MALDATNMKPGDVDPANTNEDATTQVGPVEATDPNWSELMGGDGGDEGGDDDGIEVAPAKEERKEGKGVCERCGCEEFFDDGACRACVPDDTEPDDAEPASEADVQAEHKIRLANVQQHLTEKTLDRRHAEKSLEQSKAWLKEAIALEDSAASSFERVFAEKPESRPLIDKFAKPEDDEDKEPAAGEPMESGRSHGRPATLDDDAYWMAITLTEIDVPANLVKLCANNPEKTIRTVGDLHVWSQQMGDFSDPLTKIKGIKGMGKKKAVPLEDCLIALWKRRETERSATIGHNI